MDPYINADIVSNRIDRRIEDEIAAAVSAELERPWDDLAFHRDVDLGPIITKVSAGVKDPPRVAHAQLACYLATRFTAAGWKVAAERIPGGSSKLCFQRPR